MARKLSILVFDFDGVIASELRHWDAARLAVWELLTSPRYLGLGNYFFNDAEFPAVFKEAKERVIPLGCIAELKNRCVNSNWDITFLTASLHLIHLMEQLRPLPRYLSGHRGEMDVRFLMELGAEIRSRRARSAWNGDLMGQIPAGDVSSAYHLAEEFARRLQAITGMSPSVLKYRGTFWDTCRGLFQNWYTGAKLAESPQLFVTGDDEECWRRAPAPQSTGRRKGTMFPLRRAGTIVPLPRLRALFEALRGEGYILAVATGRPRSELLGPLQRWNLLRYFDPSRLSTNDEVAFAEASLGSAGRAVRLSKPHPYAVLRALRPAASDAEILSGSESGTQHPEAVVIGDSVGDIVAAKRAGCLALAVLSGMGKEAAIRRRRRLCLGEAGADHVMGSVVELPHVLRRIAS